MNGLLIERTRSTDTTKNQHSPAKKANSVQNVSAPQAELVPDESDPDLAALIVLAIVVAESMILLMVRLMSSFEGCCRQGFTVA
jgi:hypothetical protein